jgi:hypothetical protein
MLEMLHQGGRRGPLKQVFSATTRGSFATLSTPRPWSLRPDVVALYRIPHRSRRPTAVRSDFSVLERQARRNSDSSGKMA